jgi:hypothetical protein
MGFTVGMDSMAANITTGAQRMAMNAMGGLGGMGDVVAGGSPVLRLEASEDFDANPFAPQFLNWLSEGNVRLRFAGGE